MEIFDKIIEIREFDVTYYIRTCIDNEIWCSQWYEVEFDEKLITKMTHLHAKLDKPQLRVLAFDIETTKDPLKFPDSSWDLIMMISYMVDGKGFLITNWEVIS